jgi:hypothetical protein
LQENIINTLTILDQIQALSNERQQLWRIAHRDKFSPNWWNRHDRIATIGKHLDRLWHMHRVEMADGQGQPNILDRIAGDHFEDYREHVGWYHISDWRIEDEASPHRRYMSVADGFQDNQYANYLKKPTKKLSSKPNVGARQRKRMQTATIGVL